MLDDTKKDLKNLPSLNERYSWAEPDPRKIYSCETNAENNTEIKDCNYNLVQSVILICIAVFLVYSILISLNNQQNEFDETVEDKMVKELKNSTDKDTRSRSSIIPFLPLIMRPHMRPHIGR